MVGITQNGAQRLCNFEAKYLRAITRSPVPMTKENTFSLLDRIKYNSPIDALLAQLRKPSAGDGDAWRRGALESLQYILSVGNGSLMPVAHTIREVAYPTHGLYYANLQEMRIYLTKMYGPLPTSSVEHSLTQDMKIIVSMELWALRQAH